MSSSLYGRLHVHVSASNRDVIRAVWRKIEPRQRRNQSVRSVRKSLYRDMLCHHAKAQQLFYAVQTGNV